jgi:hypothetical protein
MTLYASPGAWLAAACEMRPAIAAGGPATRLVPDLSRIQKSGKPVSSRFPAAEIYAFSEACIAQAQPADFRALSPLT